MKTAQAVPPNNYLKSSIIGFLVLMGLTGLTRMMFKFFRKAPYTKDASDIGEGFGLE